MSTQYLGLPDALWYVAPILPILTRALLTVRHWKVACDQLGEPELDRDAHLSVLLVLAGFSFSGVLALVLVSDKGTTSHVLPAYFLFISFVAFLSAGNMQGYKSRRWQDQAGTALMDVGTLCLVLALSVLWLSGPFTSWMHVFPPILAITAWIGDHGLRWTFQWRHQTSLLKEVQSNGK